MTCPPCNGDCKQGDTCPARIDYYIAVVFAVFVASCIGYVIGGFR